MFFPNSDTTMTGNFIILRMRMQITNLVLGQSSVEQHEFINLHTSVPMINCCACATNNHSNICRAVPAHVFGTICCCEHPILVNLDSWTLLMIHIVEDHMGPFIWLILQISVQIPIRQVQCPAEAQIEIFISLSGQIHVY